MIRPINTLNIGDIISSDFYQDNTKGKGDKIEYDNEWFDIRFLPPSRHMATVDHNNRMYTTASRKMTSTSFGGSYAINPVPQFSRNADIRHGNRAYKDAIQWSSRLGDAGLGRAYSEVYDDAQQLVMFKFGKERFNSIPEFLVSAIDGKDAYIARTGRFPHYRGFGEAVGMATMAVLFPWTSAVIYAIKFTAKLVFGHHNFNYYYLEPMMHLYWGAVNQLVTAVAIELGIMVPYFTKSDSKTENVKEMINNKIGAPYKIDQADFEIYKKYLPGMINDSNYIDVYAMATKTQEMANQAMLEEYLTISKIEYGDDEASVIDYMGYIFDYSSQDEYDINGNVPKKKKVTIANTFIDHTNYLFSFNMFLERIIGREGAMFGKGTSDEEERLKRLEEYKAKNKEVTKEQELSFWESTKEWWKDSATDKSGEEATKEQEANNLVPKPYMGTYSRNNDGTYDKLQEKNDNWFRRYTKGLDSSIKEDGGYAIFRVDYVGSSTDSFSNNTKPIPIGDSVNQITSTARNFRFSTMDGQTGITPIDNAITGVSNFIRGAVSGMTFGLDNLVETIFGNTYIDIPDMVEGSKMNLASHSYTMKLRSTYNTPFSILKDEIIPYCMLLCGTLPLSTGESSHGTPFICEFFSKGITHDNPAVITSLSATRGVSNLGFDKNKRQRGIDINFTVTSLSNIITAPINQSIFDAFSAALEDHRPINKYLANIASRDLLTNKYFKPRLQIRLSQFLMTLEESVSPSAYALRVGQNLVNNLGGFVQDKMLINGETGNTR